MGLTDYTYNPNSFSAVRVAIIMIATFASADADRKGLVKWCSEYLAPYQNLGNQPSAWDKDKLKQLKKQGLKEMSKFILEGKGAFAPIASLEPDITRATNIAMTLARWPEWFIYPETYLTEVAEHLWDHRDEINAITFYETDENGLVQRICPYSPSIEIDHLDLYGSLRLQEDSIEEYCKSRNIDSNISVEDTIQVLQDICRENLYAQTHDSFEKGFFDSISYIRGHVNQIVTQMRMYKSGKATDNMFGKSESRSVLSDDPVIMRALKLFGWPKTSCPNVLSNIFHTETKAVALSMQPGQIPVDKTFDYFDTAPGLGPAMKIRYVFNLIMEYQNYLSFLADLIKQADELCDPVQEAYTNQMLGLRGELSSIVDAYCIDATGYSDYLFRGIYSYILKLYGMPDDLIVDIMNIFSLPIKVGDHLCEVKFGAMQGCKLLVFVMNHANRLIGIIARRLSKQKVDSRHNAGDDTVTVSMSSIIQPETIANEMKVFAIFNCAINPLKTAHLHTDGYFDFCSKYFMSVKELPKGVVSISGIPPKLIGKDMPSIKSFTEIFRVLDVTATERNPIIHVWNICKPLLSSELEAGCKLPNALDKRYTLEEKERLALNVSYKLGGLAEDGSVSVQQTAAHALLLLERMLIKYRFEASGIFRVVQGVIPEGTELYQALGTVEHMALSKILDAVEQLRTAIDTDMIDQQDLDKCCKIITQLDRCIIKGLSISSTSSTYHRITATRDIDNLLEPDIKPDFSMLEKITSPADIIELAVMTAISAETYCDVDQIRRYMRAKDIIHQNRDRFYTQTFGGYTNYYVRDDDDKSVKLTTVDRNVGCNKSGRYKSYDEMQNQDLKFVSGLLMGNKEALRGFIELQNSVGSHVLMDCLHALISNLSKTMQNRMLRRCREYEKNMLIDTLQKQAKDFFDSNRHS